ncbi:MAG TPA: ectoine/hydroxyectoine ABC transporter permease subunit EhuD [Alphaproteobacteria bacterium]|nr:ectoine/hydroxyectoine ABC transporter permease subunit EhuD [Alphaproteobacteria bacterium]
MLFGYEWNLDSSWQFALSIVPILLTGMIVTIKATVLGYILALVLGLVLYLLRSAPLKLISWPAAAFVEFVRDTPLLVQLYFLYFVLPDYGVVMPAFVTGMLALGLQYSGYTSEVYRAGIQAVPRGQREAAIALNLSPLVTFRDVILPQAIPRVVPALGNYVISMLKDTPILTAVTIVEMLTAAKIIGDRTFRYLIPLTMVGLLFLILTLLLSYGVRQIERRMPNR